MKRWFGKKKTANEDGTIIVEATIALPVFIFAILIVLSIVDICYVQAKMCVAINSAAKEMAQYGYLYTTFELSEHMSGEGGKSSEFMQSFSTVLNEISEKSSGVSTELSELFGTSGKIAEGDSAMEYIKDGVGAALASALVKKNLVSFKDDTADNFLRRNQVVGGASGLNFLSTSFLTNMNQDEVDVVVSYKIRVLKLLNHDFTFRFIQRAQSKVWGKGVSLINPQSNDSSQDSSTYWGYNHADRGKAIVKEEKKNYTYTSDSKGFHAYNPDKNEFVRITSNIATSEDGVETALKSAFSSLYSGSGQVKTSVTLQNSAGKDVIVNTPEDGRTYKIVFVVPDNADLEMVKAAARKFEAERAALGDKVTIEVKTGYGEYNLEEPVSDENKSES